jgi:uncharacterized protein (TIGR02284 family)
MEKNAEVLNDLIKINNDRIEGYEKAAKETKDKDGDLRTVFNRMANESRTYVQELERQVRSTGESPADSTTVPGEIYRVWMDVKATFTGKDRKAILASCEYGEDAAQKAYDKALDEEGLNGEVTRVIMEQKSRLRASHDEIKRMRDSNPV